MAKEHGDKRKARHSRKQICRNLRHYNEQDEDWLIEQEAREEMEFAAKENEDK